MPQRSRHRAVQPMALRREQLILSMELRGFRLKEIAETLSLTLATVCNVTQKPSYKEKLAAKLDQVDDEFLRMKPKALRALDNALCSTDEAIGLRGADTWFKAMGYKGFGRDSVADPRVTAEDIAAQLLAAGGGSVTLTVSPGPTGLRPAPDDLVLEASQGQDDQSD